VLRWPSRAHVACEVWTHLAVSQHHLLLCAQGEIIHIVSGVAEGMAYIHTKGIIHGDVKPQVGYVADAGWAGLQACAGDGRQILSAMQYLVPL
jgi:hypothetical protein